MATIYSFVSTMIKLKQHTRYNFLQKACQIQWSFMHFTSKKISVYTKVQEEFIFISSYITKYFTFKRIIMNLKEISWSTNFQF
jgi:hypothetical protein